MSPRSGLRLSRQMLFVDDDAAVRNVFHRLVSSHGFSVDLASDGEQAIRATREKLYSVIVTDHQMPGVCGSELIARLREIQPSATLILVTGHSQYAIESCRVPGLFLVVSKPWDNDTLLTLLEASVAQSARG